MTALFELVIVNEFGIRLLRPTARRRIEFVRKDADGDRDRDTLGIEIPKLAPVLPIKTCPGKRGIRQPAYSYVVENIVAREAFGFAVKDTADQLLATRVVIEEIGRQADG